MKDQSFTPWQFWMNLLFCTDHWQLTFNAAQNMHQTSLLHLKQERVTEHQTFNDFIVVIFCETLQHP